MSSYISYFTPASWSRAQKNKADLEATNPTNPVLNDEDERFLERITTTEEAAPPLPERKTEDVKPTVISDEGDEADAKPEEHEEAVAKLEDADSAVAEIRGEKGNDESKTEDVAESKKEDVAGDSNAEEAGSSAKAQTVDESEGNDQDKTDKDASDQKDESKKSDDDDKSDEKDDKEKSDDKDEKDDKMTRSWASYLPSLPTLTKKKEGDSKTAEESKSADDDKAEAEEAAQPEQAAAPTSPASPKSNKSKKDPFPTQEEAEASTTAGIAQAEATTSGRQTEDVSNKTQRAWASYIPSMSRGTPQEQAGTGLASAIKAGKAAEEKAPLKNPDGSQTDDEKEVSVLLDRMHLSAINNRVFSFSKDSQKVYENFTVVLKDIVNGGPTAYEDLEKLIKDNEGHLDSMFGNMPPFVQTLVKSLPTKVMGSLGPEVMAAMSEKPGADMQAKMDAQSSSSASASGTNEGLTGKKKQKKSKVPSAKALVSEQGAVASMLKSIVSFLKVRFPAFVTGTNVVMSLAVFSKSFGLCLHHQ